MEKAAIIILAGTESHADMGRVSNALEAAKEFDENGDEVKLIFDGAGTEWIEELTDPEHPVNPLYEAVEHRVEGVCEFCASAFDAEEAVEEAGVDTLGEYEGHPSIRGLVEEGYEVITF